MSKWLPYAPIRSIETIIEQVQALVLIDEKETDEYKYWYQWLYQTISHLSDEEWKKIKRKVKSVKEIENFCPHHHG